MGLHGASLTIGGALAGPLAGGLLDTYGPVWAFVVSGAIGIVPALLTALVWRKAPAGGAFAGSSPAAGSAAGPGVVIGSGCGTGPDAATPVPSAARE